MFFPLAVNLAAIFDFLPILRNEDCVVGNLPNDPPPISSLKDRNMRTVVLIAMALSCGISNAQTDQPIQIIRGKQEEVDLVVQELSLNRLRFAESRLAWSSAGNFYGGFNAELIDYLGNPNTRKQLEFTEAQNKQFEKLKSEFRTAYSKIYSDFPELKDKNLPNEARKVLNKKVHLAGQKLRKEFSEKVKETLIPRQVSMVKSLRFKQTKQMFGMAHALTNNPVKEELEVTDDQKKEIQEIRKQSQIAMQKKMEEMKEEARKEMLKVLNSKQRKLLKEIEGEEEKSKSK